MSRRQECLRQVIGIGEGYENAKRELATMPWDCVAPEIEMTLSDAIGVLNRFLNGTVNAALLENWADSIELREDIAYEERNRMALREIIFQLSNPDITTPITVVSVTNLMKRLVK